ncbi:hypothetical protein BVRB_6g144910 [Beta vulgaris subsp. vulgaris]|nr:hypothetical protein BVRB_6g144910 [Beta vulgaris subsp. vulgaris]
MSAYAQQRGLDGWVSGYLQDDGCLTFLNSLEEHDEACHHVRDLEWRRLVELSGSLPLQGRCCYAHEQQFFRTEFMYVYRAEPWDFPVVPRFVIEQIRASNDRGRGQGSHLLLMCYRHLIARQKLNEEIQKRLTANQRVQEQLKMKLSKGDTKVPRAPKDPSKRPKVRLPPPTKSAIVTPQGEVDRKDVGAEDTPRPTRDAPKSKGKSVEVKEAEDVSLTRVEEFLILKKRKASEPETDTQVFTQKTTLEKADLFDSVVKRFISKPDLKVIRGLTEEEEVEHLHSSWIDTSKAGLEFAADMGLEASEVATREVMERLHDAFRRVYPQVVWSPVEAKYNVSIDATFHKGGDSDPALEVDDAIDIDDILGRNPNSPVDFTTLPSFLLSLNLISISLLTSTNDVSAFDNCRGPSSGQTSNAGQGRPKLVLDLEGVHGGPSVKLEADPPVGEGKQLPSFLAPKPEPKEVKAEAPASVKIEDPPTPSSPATSSAVAFTTASKKKPWPEEVMRLHFSALSRAELAARFDTASEHLVTELDEMACLTRDGQDVEVVKATMTEGAGLGSKVTSQDSCQDPLGGDVLGREKHSRQSTTGWPRCDSQKPRTRWAAAKDCKKADQRVEKARKDAEEAIAKARECREAVVQDWKDSDEGKAFLEDASLQASEIGYTFELPTHGWTQRSTPVVYDPIDVEALSLFEALSAPGAPSSEAPSLEVPSPEVPSLEDPSPEVPSLEVPSVPG